MRTFSKSSKRFPVSSDKRFSKDYLASLDDGAFHADCGPAERWQHSGRLLEVADTRGQIASRASEESALDVLLLQEKITPRQLTAALRLRADFLAADMGPHLVASYNPAHVTAAYHAGCDDRTEPQEEAYQSWRLAIAAVGELLADAVISVACYDFMPSEAQLLSMQIGLIKLARHYGVPELDDNVDQASARQVRVARCSSDNGVRRARLLH